MTDPDRLVASLSDSLHPLDTRISALPIEGYAPDEGPWIPRPAAVLVPILTFGEPRVVLTVRSDALPRHAGQVAFPGGQREAGDRSVVETALRETREETGIAPAAVRPLGYLGRYDTITGYRVTALVGVVSRPVEIRADPREVQAVFTVPLAHVLDPGRYRTERVEYRGRSFDLLTLEHPDHWIWGATAALLNQLRRRYRPD